MGHRIVSKLYYLSHDAWRCCGRKWVEMKWKMALNATIARFDSRNGIYQMLVMD